MRGVANVKDKCTVKQYCSTSLTGDMLAAPASDIQHVNENHTSYSTGER